MASNIAKAVHNTKNASAVAGSLADIMMKTGEMALASTQTIFHRTAMMLNAGLSPTAAQHKEFRRMGSEKVDAAVASLQAMFGDWYSLNRHLTALVQVQQTQWNMLTALASFASIKTMADLGVAQRRYFNAAIQSGEAVLRLWVISIPVANKGLKPIHSRASANAKRLMTSAALGQFWKRHS